MTADRAASIRARLLNQAKARSDGLERAALNREHRTPIMDGNLVLISAYDPSAGFNVGNAMQRNKLIYALADAALVVNSDIEKGGTWAGAVEQLDKLHFVPIYVRSNAETAAGLEGLRRKGASPWPNPDSAEALDAVLTVQTPEGRPKQPQMSIAMEDTTDYAILSEALAPAAEASPATPAPSTAADELSAEVRSLVAVMHTPRTLAVIATELNVSKSQAKDWLQQLAEEGLVEKLVKPVRYRSTRTSGLLF